MRDKFPEWPVFDDEELRAVEAVVKSKQWWIGAPKDRAGNQVWQLQEEFAKFQEADYCVAVYNGTVAIETALAALGIGLGDEVIVSDWTFVASASAVVATNAVPVFCDVDPRTFVMDVDKVESLITDRTRAIVPVHLGGNPVDMVHLKEIADQHDLKIVEDCAHAHGSRFKGTRVGNFGDAGTFSLQASKVLTAGEGGFIITNDEQLADDIYTYSDCGRHKGEHFYNHFVYGTNYRMSEFNGAVARTQLKKFPALHEKRNAGAKYLAEKLNALEGIQVMQLTPGTDESGWYVFPFVFDPAVYGGISAPEFYQKLNAAGIPTDDCYPPLHGLTCFKDVALRKGIDYSRANWGGAKSANENFPVVSDLYARSVELPQELLLADNDALDYVVETVANLE